MAKYPVLTSRITFKIRPEDAMALAEVAANLRLSVSEFVRAAAIGEAKRIEPGFDKIVQAYRKEIESESGTGE